MIEVCIELLLIKSVRKSTPLRTKREKRGALIGLFSPCVFKQLLIIHHM